MGNPLTEMLSIEKELHAERASALHRVAQGLEKLLEELNGLETEVSLSAGSEKDRVIRRYEEVRALAGRQLWYLIVQREAVGLTHHEDVYEIHKVPRSLTY
ncbi:MAG: hypothetical protein ACJ790_02870 [Myxococcaceae bacterium]